MGVGGRDWERYTGGLDELAFYDAAFTSEEARQHYEELKSTFKPASKPPRAVAGAIDGQAYNKQWRNVPLKNGSAELWTDQRSG